VTRARGFFLFWFFSFSRETTPAARILANPRTLANPRDRAIGFDPSIPVPDVSRPMNAKTLRYLPTCGDSRRLP